MSCPHCHGPDKYVLNSSGDYVPSGEYEHHYLCGVVPREAYYAPLSTAVTSDLSTSLSSVLSFLNGCRQTHIEWRDYIRDYPEDAAEYIAIAGTMEEHERYIRGYDETVELIMRLSKS